MFNGTQSASLQSSNKSIRRYATFLILLWTLLVLGLGVWNAERIKKVSLSFQVAQETNMDTSKPVTIPMQRYIKTQNDTLFYQSFSLLFLWIFGVFSHLTGTLVSLRLSNRYYRSLQHTRELSRQKETETELINAKEEAESANRSKSVFLANMSHELRTPLNGIMGYTQIFKQDKRLDAAQQDGVKVIHESAEHLLQIITDILDLSKIEEGRLELVENEYLFPGLLQQVADICKIRSKEKGLHFYFEPAADLPQVVLGDELRLRQVLLNLLTNSIKFTARGKIVLKASVLDTSPSTKEGSVRVMISVEDSGPGIAEDHQQKIFEPFHQTGNRLLYSEGSGLGLSISRKLVRMMGGTLALISPVREKTHDGDGPGSCFTVSLDLHEIQSTSKKTAPHNYSIGYKVNGTLSTSKRILLVDDNTINRVVWHEILTNAGFQVIEAKDGSEVLDACQRFHPDAVLMDLMMSPMDGYEATTILRNHDAFKDLPIIAVSAMADLKGDMDESCRKAGFNDYIAKPVIKEDLLEKLAKLLHIDIIFQGQDTPANDTKLLLPEPHKIQAILDYVLIGDLENINTEMEKIAKEGSQYQPFLAHLKKMSDNFQLDALEEALTEFIGDSHHV